MWRLIHCQFRVWCHRWTRTQWPQFLSLSSSFHSTFLHGDLSLTPFPALPVLASVFGSQVVTWVWFFLTSFFFFSTPTPTPTCPFIPLWDSWLKCSPWPLCSLVYSLGIWVGCLPASGSQDSPSFSSGAPVRFLKHLTPQVLPQAPGVWNVLWRPGYQDGSIWCQRERVHLSSVTSPSVWLWVSPWSLNFFIFKTKMIVAVL